MTFLVILWWKSQKLSWLFQYEKDLKIWAEILEVFDLAKKQLNQQGLHQKSTHDWLKSTVQLPLSPWIQSTRHKINTPVWLSAHTFGNTATLLR